MGVDDLGIAYQIPLSAPQPRHDRATRRELEARQFGAAPQHHPHAGRVVAGVEQSVIPPVLQDPSRIGRKLLNRDDVRPVLVEDPRQ